MILLIYCIAHNINILLFFQVMVNLNLNLSTGQRDFITKLIKECAGEDTLRILYKNVCIIIDNSINTMDVVVFMQDGYFVHKKINNYDDNNYYVASTTLYGNHYDNDVFNDSYSMFFEAYNGIGNDETNNCLIRVHNNNHLLELESSDNKYLFSESDFIKLLEPINNAVIDNLDSHFEIPDEIFKTIFDFLNSTTSAWYDNLETFDTNKIKFMSVIKGISTYPKFAD